FHAPARHFGGISPDIYPRHVRVQFIYTRGGAAVSKQVIRRMVEVKQVAEIDKPAVLPFRLRWLFLRSLGRCFLSDRTGEYRHRPRAAHRVARARLRTLCTFRVLASKLGECHRSTDECRDQQTGYCQGAGIVHEFLSLEWQSAKMRVLAGDYRLRGNCSSRARFSRSTLTRGSPRSPRARPSAFTRTSS